MKISIKKPTGYNHYCDGKFDEYLEKLLISFGFGEDEYEIRVPRNLTLDGGSIEINNSPILILDENKREGKNIDGLLEEISRYNKESSSDDEESLWDGKKEISRYQLRLSLFV